jgi:hypothetical protein
MFAGLSSLYYLNLIICKTNYSEKESSYLLLTNELKAMINEVLLSPDVTILKPTAPVGLVPLGPYWGLPSTGLLVQEKLHFIISYIIYYYIITSYAKQIIVIRVKLFAINQ